MSTEIKELRDTVERGFEMLENAIQNDDCDGVGNVIARGCKSIADAISADAAPGHDAAGGTVNSLTEAVMGITAGLVRIADAIEHLAEAVDKCKPNP